MENEYIIVICRELIRAFENGDLGQTDMPENANPFPLGHCEKERRSNLSSPISSLATYQGSHPVIPTLLEESLSYFTLPMALNYQRNSYELWKSALKTWEDAETRDVFDIAKVATMSEVELRQKLMKYKVALQPSKHIATWQTIAWTVYENWGSLENLLKAADFDYLKLSKILQKDYKKGFPYLSGPKIFNYWCYILTLYCGVELKNAEYIEIAPDTHITKCSVLLSLITEKEAETLTKDQISKRWRELLHDTEINPIDMHAPLWFWSRNGFIYDLNKHVKRAVK